MHDYTKTDMESLNSYLLDFHFSACETCNDVEVVWSLLKQTITDAVRSSQQYITLRAKPSLPSQMKSTKVIIPTMSK